MARTQSFDVRVMSIPTIDCVGDVPSAVTHSSSECVARLIIVSVGNGSITNNADFFKDVNGVAVWKSAGVNTL